MNKTLLSIIGVVLLPMLVLAITADAENPLSTRADGSSNQGSTAISTKRDVSPGRQTVIDSIPAPGTNHMGLGWDGTYLWNVSNASTKMAYQIDPQTGTVITTLTHPITSSILGCTYLNGSLWVLCFGNGMIYEINPTTAAIISSFMTPGGTDSRGVANNGTNLWITDASSAIAYEVTTTGSVVRSVSMAGIIAWAMDATWNYQRGTLFVVDATPRDINELDVSGATAVLLDEFAHPDQANTSEGITYDGQYLWVCSFYGNWIWKIDIGDPSPAAYFWDFETGEQGWTHTNGGTFPAAWDVVSSSYNCAGSYVIAPPDAGDSSFCIDGDAGGICHDTAMSPVVDNPGFTWFKWGMHFQNYVSYQTFTVIMRTFSSGIWNPWDSVWTYTADTPPRYDSVDVSAVTADSVQVGFVYDQPNATYAWFAAFDNVELMVPPSHDVGCYSVVSPPEGPMASGNYDVIGWIRNVGGAAETFDVVAHVYDTVGMSLIFDQTINLTLDAGADTNLNFGSFGFDPDMYFYTEIYTMLSGDADPSNDTSSVYSRTAMGLGDVVFELDVETITGNNRLLGVEFDGANFYVTGGTGTGTNSIWVVDTSGTLVTQVTQPTSSTWGMRDLAWDDVYVGSDRIDTLYASDEAGLYKFGIDLTGSFTSYGTFAGPVLPCRALGWDGDDEWFFTANWSPYYKFSKSNPNIQTTATGPGSTYGAAYDTDPVDGGWVWWHSQVGASGCQIDQMEPAGMTWPGVTFEINPTITTGIAGGLCFYEGFRNMDVLFALVQGTPDAIVGVFVRTHGTGVETGSADYGSLAFGFAPMANPVREHASISYAITRPGMVSLKVYDRTGRLVETLVNSTQNAGAQSVTWDARNVANGVYFVKLEAENQTAVQKLILVH